MSMKCQDVPCNYKPIEGADSISIYENKQDGSMVSNEYSFDSQTSMITVTAVKPPWI